jgi:hypothetical protein
MLSRPYFIMRRARSADDRREKSNLVAILEHGRQGRRGFVVYEGAAHQLSRKVQDGAQVGHCCAGRQLHLHGH